MYGKSISDELMDKLIDKLLDLPEFRAYLKEMLRPALRPIAERAIREIVEECESKTKDDSLGSEIKNKSMENSQKPKFCGFCGHALKEEWGFCAGCGRRME